MTQHLGIDLLLTPFFRATDWDALDLVSVPVNRPDAVEKAQNSARADVPSSTAIIHKGEFVDLDMASGEEALRQAIILRLLTPLGALSELGHASYGSRLGELVGQENSLTNRLRARAFVLRALAREKRIAEVLDLSVTVPAGTAGDQIAISFTVQPSGDGDPVSLGLELSL